MDKWQDKVNEYNQILSMETVTPNELVRSCKISYDAACRFKRNGISNRTKNAEKIVKYLFKLKDELKTANTANTANYETDLTKAKLNMLLNTVWDGTKEHAALIREMLLIAGKYKSRV